MQDLASLASVDLARQSRERRAPSLIAAAESYVRDQLHQELTGRPYVGASSDVPHQRGVVTLDDVERIARDANIEFWNMFSGAVWVPATELTVTDTGGGYVIVAIRRVPCVEDAR